MSSSGVQPSFVCDSRFASACRQEQFYCEIDGKRYCVLHYPDVGNQKQRAFLEAVNRKLRAQDYDFGGVDFCGQFNSFFKHCFERHARFRGAIFRDEVDFTDAEFSDQANFREARFEGKAKFHGVRFRNNVSFRDANFRGTADFSHAWFGSYARFIGSSKNKVFEPECNLTLQFVRVEKPEHVSFHTVRLKADWFVNVDVRKFELTDITWHRDMREELQRAKEVTQREPPHLPNLLLSIAYRQLAVNAEENHNYSDASEFRYTAMELLRWRQRYKDGIKHYDRNLIWRGLLEGLQAYCQKPLKNFVYACVDASKWVMGGIKNRHHRAIFSLTWWYWLMSGYGEKVGRAAIGLMLVIVSFALLYMSIEAAPSREQNGLGPSFAGALLYSLEVSLLQRPEPRPTDLAAHFLVALETFIGPLQGTLLALAIRRRFMR